MTISVLSTRTHRKFSSASMFWMSCDLIGIDRSRIAVCTLCAILSLCYLQYSVDGHLGMWFFSFVLIFQCIINIQNITFNRDECADNTLSLKQKNDMLSEVSHWDGYRPLPSTLDLPQTKKIVQNKAHLTGNLLTFSFSFKKNEEISYVTFILIIAANFFY